MTRSNIAALAAAVAFCAGGAGAAPNCHHGQPCGQACIPLTETCHTPTPPRGATALCRDHTWTFTHVRDGACSHHGGVERWL